MIIGDYIRLAELHAAQLLGEASARNDATAKEEFTKQFSGDVEAEAEYTLGLTQQWIRQQHTSKCVALATAETYANFRLSIKILEEAGWRENADFLSAYLNRLEAADERIRSMALQQG